MRKGGFISTIKDEGRLKEWNEAHKYNMYSHPSNSTVPNSRLWQSIQFSITNGKIANKISITERDEWKMKSYFRGDFKFSEFRWKGLFCMNIEAEGYPTQSWKLETPNFNPTLPEFKLKFGEDWLIFSLDFSQPR